MNQSWRLAALTLTLLALSLSLCSCGGQPWRFDPGPVQKPTGLIATAGNGKVTLSWVRAQGTNSSSYNVYYSTSSGISTANATRITGTTGTSATVSGLANGTRYFFAVSAVNGNGESALSEEADAVPSLQGAFLQSDLQGAWRFNALVSAPGAKWMRGALSVDAAGAVSVTSYLDSSGATTAPSGLFGTLAILPDGSVRQSGGADDFNGTLSANLYRDLLAATATFGGTSRIMLILQKAVPGIKFDASDIQGTGKAGAGPLPIVYHQISSGAVSEWEYASCQVGRDQAETYLALTGPTPRPVPGAGGKVVTLSITDDGVVSESANPAVLPQPSALISSGFMSADKMTVVGTATDSRGAYLMRVIQFVHPPSVALTASSYTLAGLAGSYGYQALLAGTAAKWISGRLGIDGSGGLSFGSYLDSAGGTRPPDPLLLTIDQQGVVTVPADPSYHGQLSYFQDMVVSTRTEPGGVGSLGIALRGLN